MTQPHDELFSTPPPLESADPKDYPARLKPGDAGSIKAFCAKHDIPYEEKTGS